MTTLNIRNIDDATVAYIKAAAGARGWTIAEFVTALARLHELAVASDEDQLLVDAGIAPVRI